MRRHLQWQPASGDVATGFKAGSLPGVLTVGMEQRVVGTKRHATGALLIGGLDEAMASSTDFGWQELLVEAVNDPTYARRVIATLDARRRARRAAPPPGRSCRLTSCAELRQLCLIVRTASARPGMARSIVARVVTKPSWPPYQGSGTPSPGFACGS
mgnify:CR=1 FL=1